MIYMNHINNVKFFIRVTGKNIIPIQRSVINFYHLTIILKGSLTYIIDGKEVTVEENDALLLPNGTDRERYGSEAFADFIIFNYIPTKEHEISSPILFKNAVNQPINTLLNTYPYTYFHASNYSKHYRKQNAEYTKTEKNKINGILHNLFNCILIDLFDFLNYKTKNPHVINILKYIDANIMAPLALNDVSEAVHISKEYTARVFKKEMNMTVTEYINRQKLSIAKTMLTSNQLSLREISERLGYRNYNYFSRVFKECYGISPIKVKTDLKNC